MRGFRPLREVRRAPFKERKRQKKSLFDIVHKKGLTYCLDSCII